MSARKSSVGLKLKCVNIDPFASFNSDFHARENRWQQPPSIRFRSLSSTLPRKLSGRIGRNLDDFAISS